MAIISRQRLRSEALSAMHGLALILHYDHPRGQIQGLSPRLHPAAPDRRRAYLASDCHHSQALLLR